MLKKLFTFTPPKEEYNFEIKKSLPDVKTEKDTKVSLYLFQNKDYLDRSFKRETSYDIRFRRSYTTSMVLYQTRA